MGTRLTRRGRRPVPWAVLALTAAVLTAPAAVVAPVAAQLASQVTAADQAKIFKAHNDARGEVGSAPLAWDAQLASDAQAWADHLVADRNGALDHGPNSDPRSSRARKQGENINGGNPAADMARGWYAEKSLFDPAKPAFDISKGYGHYTQMIWSTTTRVGCGTAAGGMWGRVNVCRYAPPGNYPGESPLPASATGSTGSTGTGAAARVVSSSATTFPCSDPRGASPGGGEPADIAVVNRSAEELRVSWIDLQGGEQQYFTVAPGATNGISSFAGHRWLVSGRGGCVTGFLAPGTVTIG